MIAIMKGGAILNPWHLLGRMPSPKVFLVAEVSEGRLWRKRKEMTGCLKNTRLAQYQQQQDPWLNFITKQNAQLTLCGLSRFFGSGALWSSLASLSSTTCWTAYPVALSTRNCYWMGFSSAEYLFYKLVKGMVGLCIFMAVGQGVNTVLGNPLLAVKQG